MKQDTDIDTIEYNDTLIFKKLRYKYVIGTLFSKNLGYR